MGLQKRHSQIERHDCLRSRINRARLTTILLTALVGLLTLVGQTLVPTAQTSTIASNPGDLNARRSSHTATLLTTGKVVIVGGQFGSDATGLSDTELFDPETGTWSSTGNTLGGRLGHTATLLANGKVLAAAGDGVGDVSTNSAELYDPATGKWSATGNLITARNSHTATLLPDGRVLAAGGAKVFTSGLINSSELYNSNNETWTGPVVPVITGTLVTGKRLILFGENFGPDAGIWRNRIRLQTKVSGDTRKRVAKKGAVKIKPGDKLQVLNPSGALSQEFTFTAP